MCEYEVVGDRYTGCGHFVALYETGEVTDCMSEDCKTSSAHKHKTAKNCGCPAVKWQRRKIQNMFRTKCPDH
ncbi:hypothetical protein PUNSTDRAFT_91335 [Punctularia strigosozonata HHB-11173 SS5]|uniref:uncharacterized protein n=1 Tax=Punctularia strigosozonata (strain HHB-11173) TaxID=741275 RepID=UPI0004416413|nr:uncharacterized protein PUNSTDRAFT_91335 [Punctularia strigosozonata HHB-11173 SS5]EIN05754.1 hypothetical protein PUNSTDRAFT_91335 [Punctularia strigosozonata HHB-11173 SS5]